MSVAPPSWVNTHVMQACKMLEQSTSYTDAERARWLRLVSDLRMQQVYTSPYLNKRFSPDGWRCWFDIARGVGDVAAGDAAADGSLLKQERERLKAYAQMMQELDCHLEAAVSLLRQIDGMDIVERHMPFEMHNMVALIKAAAALAQSQGESLSGLDFDFKVRPKLEAISRDGGKHMPSVLQVFAALSGEVAAANMLLNESGPIASDAAIAAALRTRQHSPLAEYVRAFDARMQEYAFLFGDDFLMPSEVMALQAGVALDLVSVDKKSVANARKG